MKQTLVLLALLISLAESTCTKQLIEVGIGYNLISGNPRTSPDPGLKRSNQILRHGEIQEYEAVDEQTKYCAPEEIAIIPQSYCSYVEETKFFAGTESYREVLEADVTPSGNAGQLFKWHNYCYMPLDYGLYTFSFSASNGKLYNYNLFHYIQ